KAVEGREQFDSRPRRSAPGVGQHVGQRNPTEVRHAEQVKARHDVDMVRVDGNDVSMLQQGERLRFARAGARDLQGYTALRQMPPFGEEPPRDPTSADFLHQPEIADRLADPGERGGQRKGVLPGWAAPSRTHELVDVEQLPDLAGNRGETGLIL